MGAAVVSDFGTRMKKVQDDSRTLIAKRDAINREAGGEEQRVKVGYDNLKALGIIEDASKHLSVKELKELQNKYEGLLALTLTEIEKKLAEGKNLIAEYEATAA